MTFLFYVNSFDLIYFVYNFIGLLNFINYTINY